MLVWMILLPQGTRRKTAPSFKSQFHALQHPSLQGIIAHPQTWYNTPSFKYILVKTLFLFIAGKMPVCNFGAKFWVLSVVNVVQGTACHCLVFLHDHNIYMHHQPSNRENLTDWSVKFEFNTSMITSCQKFTFCNRIWRIMQPAANWSAAIVKAVARHFGSCSLWSMIVKTNCPQSDIFICL